MSKEIRIVEIPLSSAAKDDCASKIRIIRDDMFGEETYNSHLQTRALAVDILHSFYIATPAPLWDSMIEILKSYSDCKDASERIDWANRMFKGRFHYE